MLDAWRAPGREVAVIGLGKSGLAAGLLLSERGVRVYASDSGTSERHQQWADALRAAGATVELGGHDLEKIRSATAAVVAPGGKLRDLEPAVVLRAIEELRRR